jgi:hypothetical protein
MGRGSDGWNRTKTCLGKNKLTDSNTHSGNTSLNTPFFSHTLYPWLAHGDLKSHMKAASNIVWLLLLHLPGPDHEVVVDFVIPTSQ